MFTEKEWKTDLIKMLKKSRQQYLRKHSKDSRFPIYTKLNHVSNSGMYRAISVYIVVDGSICKLDYYLTKIAPKSFRFDQRHGGIKSSGCGMDMGFELVYRMFSYLDDKQFKDWQSIGAQQWL